MQDPTRGRAQNRRDGSRTRPATPPASAIAVASDAESDHRARLVEGMAAALVEKGYADVSVADVVQHARVSKRTFYEHFADKEGCYLATYSALSDDLLARIAEAGQADLPAEERLVAATRAYLAALEERPALTRTFLTEIQAAGPEALKLRRGIHQRFSELLRLLVERGRKERPGLRPISPEMAAALVGGINELVLLTIEDGRGRHLHEIGDTVVELLRAVLLAPERTAARRAHRRRRGVGTLGRRRTA